jgi:hypothetical protein
MLSVTEMVIQELEIVQSIFVREPLYSVVTLIYLISRFLARKGNSIAAVLLLLIDVFALQLLVQRVDLSYINS